MFASRVLNHSMALPGPKDVKKPNVEISGKNFNSVEPGISSSRGRRGRGSVSYLNL